MTTITLKGTPIHTIGQLPTVGSKAPDFILTKTDLGEMRLHECTGKTTILNIFPSLDTATCASSVVKFNNTAAENPNVLVLCVSADLPFAQKRFCMEKKLENVMPVSTFRNTDFGKNYGVLITDGPLAGLLSRAVVVIDTHGNISYTQQVQEISEEPNYQEVLKLLTH